ncbi:DUF2163 domain-containing protein [Sphingobium sp. C100]|uniref:DUF2163 domain-containing protein n=1 Tax=Sphingobium sp. C100 TaxID=1207055 RepID=UPI00269082A1
MSAAEMLDATLCTHAFCWRIARRDGVTIGLCSHDRDLEIGGLLYRAAPGMTPSAVRSGITLEGEDSDVAGAISSDAISAADLMAGRWDGAELEVRLTQWEAPGALWLLLARGEIGAVSRKGAAFSAEMIGAAAVLGEPAAPSTAPDCRARLGDRREDRGGGGAGRAGGALYRARLPRAAGRPGVPGGHGRAAAGGGGAWRGGR